ncbi:hypothetical protein HPB50_023783 [Hyalomma asiaticum]|uniref:Uncharacterized protein n=1 Tax=Hyalomma asiaticum TaxID=266040 RepID=A0ACB7RQ35_HYAAI|nr:hypothetical protein HPB50_023783 [Hyalomma asiaticum]
MCSSQVCEAEQCRPEVYPLAMNCLDRFLSVRSVRKCQLQLTGAVCMLLASKFRQTKPLSLQRLSMYTDYSVSTEELKDWELVVVSTLKWDVCGVIACDFLDHLIHRLELPKEAVCSRDHICTHAQTFISLCYTAGGGWLERCSIDSSAAQPPPLSLPFSNESQGSPAKMAGSSRWQLGPARIASGGRHSKVSDAAEEARAPPPLVVVSLPGWTDASSMCRHMPARVSGYE